MIEILSNPRLFNDVMMCLQLCAAIRWGVAGQLCDCLYWIGAFILTLALTYKT